MIIFPLEYRSLTRGCAAHKADGLGCAADYAADDNNLYAPVAGKVFLFQEAGGGNWIRITDSAGTRWEMAHLGQRFADTGELVGAGDLIGKTDNTGTITTGPHLHIQIIEKNGQRLDPTILLTNAQLPMSTDPYANCIIRLGGVGSYAYVKGNDKQKQIITKENSGLANITFLDRADMARPIADQIITVDKARWDSYTTVPDGTWF